MAFLGRMTDGGVVPAGVAAAARAVWEGVRRAVPGTPVPAASAFRGGPVHYTWDRGRHHLEMEFLSEGTREWFYRDRESESLAGDEDCSSTELPADLVVYLRTMYADS